MLALNTKTFGYKNRQWILACFLAIKWCYFAQMSAYLIENILNLDYLRTEPDFPRQFAIVHYLGFFLEQAGLFVFFHYLDKAPLRSYPKYYRITGILAILTPIYLFNPWVVEYQSQAGEFYSHFKYTFMFQSIQIPTFLIALVVMTWILWRMSNGSEDLVLEKYEDWEVTARGLNKKTFGIKNGMLLLLFIVYLVVGAIIPPVVAGIERILKSFEPLTPSDHSIVICFFFLWFLQLLNACLVLIAFQKPAKFYRSCAKKLIVSLILFAVVICIIFHEKMSDNLFNGFKYTMIAVSGTVLLSIFASCCATWILLKMARIQEDWDEPYAVICGNEDSTTKTLIQKIE